MARSAMPHTSRSTYGAARFRHRISTCLDMRAALGRTFAPDEEHPTRNHVIVLSHRLWVSQFGSDPAVIGKPVRLDREVHTVIGVMPAGSGVDLLDPELWTPRDLGHEGGALTVGGATSRNRRDLNRAVARLKRGVTIEQARSQMDEIGRRLAQAYPESNRGWGVSVQPWPRPVSAGFEQSLYLLFAAAAIVFLIGCVNLANLALVRGTARSRELAIRLALGAGRSRARASAPHGKSGHFDCGRRGRTLGRVRNGVGDSCCPPIRWRVQSQFRRRR